MGAYLINGEFQSDKYPTTPRGRIVRAKGDKMPGYWVALKRCGHRADNLWKVDGGGTRLGFFLDGADEKTLAEYVDPQKWRFVHSPVGPTIGMTIPWDGVGQPPLT